MVKRNYKGRCVKKSVSKAKEVCRTYSDIQLAFLDVLEENTEIAEINVMSRSMDWKLANTVQILSVSNLTVI